jgi:hypothetical protein
MAAPTYQDASVMLGLLQLASSPPYDKAMAFVWGPDFIADYTDFVKKYPTTSDEYGHVLTIAGWFESLATLWKHQLFNEQLLFDWLNVNRRWVKLEEFIKGLREATAEPTYFENFEALAKAQAVRVPS